MERNIWVINDNKSELVMIQQKINSSGGVRAICLPSCGAVKKAMDRNANARTGIAGSGSDIMPMNRPSLIIVDYNTEEREQYESYRLIESNSAYAGIPMVFLVDYRDDDIVEECYEKGAGAILSKSLKKTDILRIKRMAWQYEKTANYEKILQKQVTELQTAKQIRRLNEQLQSRNDLLYQVFGRYFTDDVVEKILSGPSGSSIGGEKKVVTVLMADLRGFTSISEKMAPDRLTDMINYFLGEMTEVILKYHGTIMEFIGDAILAIFGAPVELECCEEDAIAAAIDMQNSMRTVNGYNRDNGYPQLEMGIGIHKGEVFVGNIGSDRMMRYNVMGNTVNQCSRIESCSVGGQILVSGTTIENIRDIIEVRNTFSIAAKGLSEMIDIWEICGIMGKYNENLHGSDNEKLLYSKRNIRLMMNEIQDKSVNAACITGVLSAYSSKKCIVTMSDNKKLEKLANVIISAYDRDVSDELFSKLYAKLVEKNDNEYVFRITGNSREYSEWMEAEQIRKEKYMSIGELSEDIYIHEKYPFVVEMVDEGESYNEEMAGRCMENIKGVLVTIQPGTENANVKVVSNTEAIRAVEFVDFVFGEYGIIDGDTKCAEGNLSRTILNAAMEDENTDDVKAYMIHKCEKYFSDTEVFFAGRDEIDTSVMDKYVKKKIPWAVVKSEDIAEEGTVITVRSLENSGGTQIVAGKNTYVMIGIRGEVYDIDSEKFASSYTVSDEKLDVFESMMEFMPAVEIGDKKDYLAIDELAHLCYPNSNNFIYARELKKRAKVFRINKDDEYFAGNKGDYLVARGDDLKDIYIIQGEIFRETYTSENF